MRARRAIALVLPLVALAGAASPVSSAAVATTRLDHIPHERIMDAVRALDLSGNRGVVFRHGVDGRAAFLLNNRTAPSEVERHADWDDVLYVLSGRGTVLHGEEAKDAYMFARGEWRGGTLRNPSRQAMGPGDVVRIPAGVAHEIHPAGPGPLTYLVVKVRRSDGRPAAGRFR